MDLLTSGNTRKEFEQRAIIVIKKQIDEFSIQDIYNAMLLECDGSVAHDFIAEIITNAIDFCLSTGIAEFVAINTFQVNPMLEELTEEVSVD